MPDEAIVREQTAQIRVALKQNAKEIKRFSFIPVGARPDTDHAPDTGAIFRQISDHPESVVSRHRQQVIHHCKAFRVVVFYWSAVAVIHATEIDKLFKTGCSVIPQGTQKCERLITADRYGTFVKSHRNAAAKRHRQTGERILARLARVFAVRRISGRWCRHA